MRTRDTERDEVRLCQHKDIGAILEILAEAPEAASWSLSAIEGTLERNTRYFLVAQSGGKITGFVAGRRIADEGEILNLAVKKGRRRQGAGSAMVGELLEILRGEGVTQVYLEVRESNLGAMEFYQGLGFEPGGRRPGYYHDPEEAALLLRMNLAKSPREKTGP